MSIIRVAIADQQRLVRLDRRRLRDIVRDLLIHERVKSAEISLAFVDDATIQRLNRRFLEHDEPTDVITFPLSVPGEKLSGEIVISTETARHVARDLGHDAHDEVSYYVIHGLLHLCSYDDRRPKERKKMRAREAYYLRKCGIRLSRRL